MKSFSAVLAGLALASTVAAHGYVQSMLINGQTYPGFLPFTDNYADPLVDTKITRHIPDDGPVLDYTSTNLTCNVGAEDPQWRTNQTATVTAGSDMSFTWVRWPDDHLGPNTVWMANCGGSCTDFDGSGPVWFKIDELGLVSGTTDTGTWASTLLIKNNLTWTVTIPAGLASGNYLIRQELLALHSAHAPQFYPSCAQLVVTGSGTSTPPASEMVAIPGYYTNDTSTNIDIWQNGQTSYPIAGPPVTSLQSYTGTNPKNLAGANVTAPTTTANGSGASSTNNATTSDNGSTTSNNNTGDATTALTPTKSKNCRVKTSSKSGYAKRHAVRRLLSGH